ncbi:hypothetical protein [Arthrobacter sp. UM1]|uniref:hypothetical protein n=1 Tax=Arthrobacter sp. UM1 TaxID=2766776 RepID=UPI001CF6E31C|nr:hypothetical protein [Arthrobacter sp. UM1]MCB4207179.1 hypothetical protein [Arthrobacter sp. UM1]
MNDDGAAREPSADTSRAAENRPEEDWSDEDWAEADPEWTRKADRLESRLRRGEVSMTEAEAELRRLLDDQSLPPEAPARESERGRMR